VLDLAQWITLQLEQGRYDGSQIIAPDRIAEMHAAPRRDQVHSPANVEIPSAPMSNYGLGWFFNVHGGRRVIEHSGTQNGFVAWVALLPEEHAGLVVLSNHHRTGLNVAIRSWILDALLQRSPRDWSEEVRADYTTGYQRQLREAKAEFESQRPASFSPPRAITDYAGRYEHELYGDVDIAPNGDRLTLRFGSRFEGELRHWQNDAFRVLFSNPLLDDWLVTFAVKEGTVTGLHVKESPWAPAWYEDAEDLGTFQRQ
jgi:hypothetical protein